MTHRERALRLVKQEIDRAIARPACPQCRSQWVKENATVGYRGGVWRWKRCHDCLEVFDAEWDT